MAISKYDQFDFLIDIVPREEIKSTRIKEEPNVKMNADQVQYYFQLAQPPNQSSNTHSQVTTNANTTVTTPSAQGIQIIQPQIQTVQLGSVDGSSNQNSTAAAGPTTFQLIQQIVTPNGEIQQIPVSFFKYFLSTNFGVYFANFFDSTPFLGYCQLLLNFNRKGSVSSLLMIIQIGADLI